MRERRPARFRCLDNDHHFEQSVWQVGQTVEEEAEPFNWTVADPDSIRCPECRYLVEVIESR